MKKILINACYGGFGNSKKAADMYKSLSSEKGLEPLSYDLKLYGLPRDCPIAISIVETLGKESWGTCSKLEIVEIPTNADWKIQEYDGKEWVETFMVLTKEELSKGLTPEKIQELTEVDYIRLSSE